MFSIIPISGLSETVCNSRSSHMHMNINNLSNNVNNIYKQNSDLYVLLSMKNAYIDNVSLLDCEHTHHLIPFSAFSPNPRIIQI